MIDSTARLESDYQYHARGDCYYRLPGEDGPIGGFGCEGQDPGYPEWTPGEYEADEEGVVTVLKWGRWTCNGLVYCYYLKNGRCVGPKAKEDQACSPTS